MGGDCDINLDSFIYLFIFLCERGDAWEGKCLLLRKQE